MKVCKCKSIGMVHEWNKAFNVKEPEFIDLTNEDINTLVVSLLEEEVRELKAALAARDPVGTLDGLTDIQFVLDGAYLRLGYSPRLKDLAFLEVFQSNMSKLDKEGKPILREDGKILKSDSYVPPNLAGVLDKYIKEIGD